MVAHYLKLKIGVGDGRTQRTLTLKYTTRICKRRTYPTGQELYPTVGTKAGPEWCSDDLKSIQALPPEGSNSLDPPDLHNVMRLEEERRTVRERSGA